VEPVERAKATASPTSRPPSLRHLSPYVRAVLSYPDLGATEPATSDGFEGIFQPRSPAGVPMGRYNIDIRLGLRSRTSGEVPFGAFIVVSTSWFS